MPTDDPGNAEMAGLFGQALIVAAVAIEHGHCAFRHAGEDAALLVGDRLLATKVADMDRPDIGDDPDMRLDLAGQRFDLAGVIHADLKHAVARLARQAREADRHADMVVVAGHAGGGRRFRRQHRAQGILGAGLPDRTGDAGDARRAPVTGGAAEFDQRLHRVGNADQGAPGAFDVARDDGSSGTARQGVGNESVAVGRLAAQREEEVTFPDGAAVEGHALGVERRGDRPRRRAMGHMGGHEVVRRRQVPDGGEAPRRVPAK